MDPDVPLIVPQVNSDHLNDIKKNIIANPNCSTAQLVIALKPLHDLFKIKRIVVSTYQSVSGGGKAPMDELIEQTKQVLQNNKVESKNFTKQIAFNAIPHIDVFADDGYTKEELSAVAWNMPNRLNFLTIVPMFHCNGWCYPWTIAMLNGRTICLRNIDVKKIFELIDKYNVTHFGGAPIILNMITGAPESDRKELKQKVHVLTAGAPPPSIIFKKMKLIQH